MHLSVLRELTHFSVRTILISFESVWQVRELPVYWKKVIASSAFLKEKKEDAVQHRPVSLSFI